MVLPNYTKTRIANSTLKFAQSSCYPGSKLTIRVLSMMRTIHGHSVLTISNLCYLYPTLTNKEICVHLCTPFCTEIPFLINIHIPDRSDRSTWVMVFLSQWAAFRYAGMFYGSYPPFSFSFSCCHTFVVCGSLSYTKTKEIWLFTELIPFDVYKNATEKLWRTSFKSVHVLT